MKFQTYGFIGLGLIGGSLAKAIRSKQPDCRIMAYTRTRETTEMAQKDGTLNEICSSVSDSRFAQCDMIFLCAPVSKNIEALQQLKTFLPKSCLITDVGSVKTQMHEAVHEAGLDAQFIGGHPMTGSEKSGYAVANEHLFENTYYVITPSSDTLTIVTEAYKDLVTGIGALPLVIDYRTHDYITAAVSHLPHLVAAALVNSVHKLDTEDELMKLIAAGGFKDITRIASSSPEMWEPICVANQANISTIMDTFIEILEQTREQMCTGNGQAVYDLFEESRDYRNSFASSGPGMIRKTYRIFCDLVDESGAIATVATILSVNGISIKNIGIVHNREFEEGVCRIEFYEEEPSLKAAAILRQHHYEVFVR